MSSIRSYIVGTGVVCALGNSCDQIIRAIEKGQFGLRPLTQLVLAHPPALPVGQVDDFIDNDDIPRTHQMARCAADQAMNGQDQPPDAIVIGCTTGGMAATEAFFRQSDFQVNRFPYHGLGTVAEDLARRYRCKGPVLTVSTACSSGSVAMALALAMIRSGQYRRVLTGGADALCRITYFGFKSLQLIDPAGARPLDQDRRGMSVAEGAGILLLEASKEISSTGIELMGAGLSCDAHHPAQPHPEGKGALAAMQNALTSAGLSVEDIEYINLHGTGTIDNDRSEMRAINSLYRNAPPFLSSIKGATGHTLAAAGAIEAVVAVRAIDEQLIPANTGCQTPDPLLCVRPVQQVIRQPIRTVLSNSFGFGGNNAAVIIGRSRNSRPQTAHPSIAAHPFEVVSWSALTGTGMTASTLENFSQGKSCAGKLDIQALCKGLPSSMIRRLKRLSIMALNLFSQTQAITAPCVPKSVFLGTGWGSLSETYDFLKNLFASNEKFSSPTDFIGSVHNAAAGQISILAGATGPNLTLTGSDYSFEQALFSAQLLIADDAPFLVMGLDECHEEFSALLNASVRIGQKFSDGGGALILRRTMHPKGPTVQLKYMATDFERPPNVLELIEHLGGAGNINATYGLILIGIPAMQSGECQRQFEKFSALTRFSGKVIDYRRLTGEFATSSAVATVMATALIKKQQTADTHQKKAILVLGLGSALTAIEIRSS